ncbi:MAG: bifunctional metallophosphatase/5'-nucleotidase, partial [Parasporobacterium sp.]|nr:bifunctional metallophosphatase/5'-nucleotidase [Parasporobacterium sp.]
MPSRISPKRHLTILHSNDLHGDFLPQEKNGVTTGGINYLAGYVKKVRSEEENVLYVNAGDMFRGSVIDAEYRGLSTIDLMNSLSPDVSTIGNHEVDYGLAHLLFLEKCARFPIINANLLVTLNNARLFQPYLQKEVGGLKILFIGILTEEVLAMTKSEKVIGTFIDIEAAAKEIGIICDNYRTRHTDMVVLLTHI